MNAYLKSLLAHQLTIDHNLQRDIVTSQLRKMEGDQYDPNALGIFIISKRRNGTYVIIDGQHRWRIVSEQDPQRELTCMVYEDLTTKEEADLFLMYNNQTAVNPIGRFRAAVVAGRPLPVAVAGIFAKYGLEIGTGQQEIAAVGDCLRVASWRDGLNLLEQSLDILTNAWAPLANKVEGQRELGLSTVKGNRPYRGTIITGMARVLHRYGDAVNQRRMANVLTELGSRGPERIARDAGTLKATMTYMSVDELTAHVLVRLYNTGTGGMKLKNWALDGSVQGDDASVNARPGFNTLVAADIPQRTDTSDETDWASDDDDDEDL